MSKTAMQQLIDIIDQLTNNISDMPGSGNIFTAYDTVKQKATELLKAEEEQRINDAIIGFSVSSPGYNYMIGCDLEDVKQKEFLEFRIKNLLKNETQQD